MLQDHSFEQVLHEHQNRIYYYLHALKIPYQLQDEFYAEGLYAMWQGYKRYDKSKGQLPTFLNYQIRFAMIDLIRTKERHKQITQKVTDLQTIDLHSGNRNRNTDQPLISNKTPHIFDDKLWLDLKNKLTDRQWKWVYYFIILDWPLKDIAKKENVTIETVKGWAKMTRQKLRRNLSFKKRLYELVQL